MTISLCWVRSLSASQELVFVSDSRLTGGYTWDSAQKIFPLHGLNAVIAFSGDTDMAMPVIHQIRSSCENYGPLYTGAMDVNDVRSHILRVINAMRDEILGANKKFRNDLDRSVEFLFGGYSFLQQRFVLNKLRYNRSVGGFTKFNATNFGPKRAQQKMVFSGDYYSRFMARLAERMRGRDLNGFDFEPLQTLADLLRDPSLSAIGGSPQMVKVYKHRNFLPYAFYWGEESSVHLFGRRFLEYEKTLWPIMNCDTLQVHYPLADVRN